MPTIAKTQYTTWEEKAHCLPLLGAAGSTASLGVPAGLSFYRHSKLLRSSRVQETQATQKQLPVRNNMPRTTAKIKYSQIPRGELIFRKLFEKQDSCSASCPNHSLIPYSVKPRLHRTSSLAHGPKQDDVLTWQPAGAQPFYTHFPVQ